MSGFLCIHLEMQASMRKLKIHEMGRVCVRAYTLYVSANVHAIRVDFYAEEEVTCGWPDWAQPEGEELLQHSTLIHTKTTPHNAFKVSTKYHSKNQMTLTDLFRQAKNRLGDKEAKNREEETVFLTLSTSGLLHFSGIVRESEGYWHHDMYSPTNKSVNMDTFDSVCNVCGGVIHSLCCINRHCPQAAVKSQLLKLLIFPKYTKIQGHKASFRQYICNLWNVKYVWQNVLQL